MNPFEMVVAIIAIVTIAQIVRAKLGVPHRHRHGGCGQDVMEDAQTENDRLRGEVAALKARVAVLERIATDSSATLEREFEKLKGEP